MEQKEQEKRSRLLTALEQGMVMIHLDARRPGVLVPVDLKAEAHLRLNLSYRFDPPDLTINDWGVRSTLSFKGQRFIVAVPWSALFAVHSYASEDFWMYPDDMPPELVERALLSSKVPMEPSSGAESRQKTVLREVVMDRSADNEPKDDPPKPAARGHLRVVK